MIAANANTVFNAMDYQADNKLVAYAASNTVLLLDTYHRTTYGDKGEKSIPTPKVIGSLNVHTSRVNAVQWISNNLLVSIGGDEKGIAIWEAKDPRDPASWAVKQYIKEAHPATLTQLTTRQVSREDGTKENYFATVCMGGVLKVWACTTSAEGVTSEVVQKSELLFGRNLQETVSL